MLSVVASWSIHNFMDNKSFFSRWGPVIAWMGIIYLVSSISNPYAVVPGFLQIPDEILGRFSHVFEYAVLALLVVRAIALRECLISRNKIIAVSLIVSLSYSLFDEFHQSFVPGRTFQLLDLGLDLLGVIFGLTIGSYIYLIQSKSQEF